MLISAQVVELWLVRHGETEANAGRITQGQQQGRLTRAGAHQAAALGARLKKEHAQRNFDAVLCSDLLALAGFSPLLDVRSLGKQGFAEALGDSIYGPHAVLMVQMLILSGVLPPGCLWVCARAAASSGPSRAPRTPGPCRFGGAGFSFPDMIKAGVGHIYSWDNHAKRNATARKNGNKKAAGRRRKSLDGRRQAALAQFRLAGPYEPGQQRLVRD